MRTFHHLVRNLILPAAFATTFPEFAEADLRNGQPAQSVLGKRALTDGSILDPSAETLKRVSGLALDPATGKLFVSDYDNHRILRYSGAASYQNGAAAEAVLGQADFVSGEANRGGTAGAGTLNYPEMIAIDPAGCLWVADSENHRVLRFDDPSGKANGAAADGVIGQTNFTNNAPATTQTGLRAPVGVAVGLGGALWVSDTGNSRVLRYDYAVFRDNGAPANGVLGAEDFISRGGFSPPSNWTFKNPRGIATDGEARLWVADSGNHRLVRFDRAVVKLNGGRADGVLGQNDLFSGMARVTSATSISSPNGLTMGPDGTLWVSDSGSSRVIGFRNVADKADGAAADWVLGQAGFNDLASPTVPTATNIRWASQVVPDAHGGLFVGDNLFHRVMRFSPGVVLNAPSRGWVVRRRVTIRGSSEHAVRVEYRAGTGPYRIVRGTPSSWVIVLTPARDTTRVQIRAVAFDGRTATRVVAVRAPRQPSRASRSPGLRIPKQGATDFQGTREFR
jgi:sugar lactone lactonase YvrE